MVASTPISTPMDVNKVYTGRSGVTFKTDANGYRLDSNGAIANQGTANAERLDAGGNVYLGGNLSGNYNPGGQVTNLSAPSTANTATPALAPIPAYSPAPTPTTSYSPVTSAAPVAATSAPTIAPVQAVQDQSKGTVAGQVQGLIDANSPLMQRASSQGLAMANDRGLINSGMAIGSAQNAVLDHAVQIATPDAAANNQFALTNAGEANAANKFNASNIQQTNLAASAEANTTARANAANANQVYVTQLDTQNRAAIAAMDSNTRQYLGNLDANSRMLVQTDASAASLFSNYLGSISQLQNNAGYQQATPEAKQIYVKNLTTALTDGIKVQGAISNLNLSSLLV